MTALDLVFVAAVSMLLVHEMDAVDKQEWQLLFVLRRLPNDRALRWFVALHLPLYVALLVLIAAGPSAVVHVVESAVAAFLVVHTGLHERLAHRTDTGFDNPLSRLWIWGGGTLAVVYLAGRIVA